MVVAGSPLDYFWLWPGASFNAALSFTITSFFGFGSLGPPELPGSFFGGGGSDFSFIITAEPWPVVALLFGLGLTEGVALTDLASEADLSDGPTMLGLALLTGATGLMASAVGVCLSCA